MANIKWDTLITIEDWAGELGTILDEAKIAVAEENSDRKFELQKLLREYIKRSPSKCDSLDDIAHQAGTDIFLNIVNESLKAIASRNAELKKATRLIETVTEEAGKDKKAILFEDVIEGIDKVKGIAEILKELKGELSDPEADLLDKFEAVMDAVEQYRKGFKKEASEES